MPASEWHRLGSAPVNPALQTNRIHCFLALGAHKVAEQDLDEGEAIRTHELPLSEFIERVEAGTPRASRLAAGEPLSAAELSPQID